MENQREFKRGRPRQLDYDTIDSELLKNKHRLVDNNQLVSKMNVVWLDIASTVKMKPFSLHAYVCRNTNGIKEKLIPTLIYNKSITETDLVDSSGISENNGSITENKIILYFSKAEVQEMLQQKTYKRNEAKKARLSHRNYFTFKPNKWQTLIIEKLDEENVKCGFQFENHKIYNLTDTAHFSGHCRCGGTLRGQFHSLQTEIIKVTCYLTKGSEKCGKRYLKGEDRMKIGKQLYDTGKSASVFRSELAGELIGEGDKQEPAILAERSTYKQAKSDYVRSLHVHKDPIEALDILMGTKLKTAIHNLGKNPIFVHYWTSSQLHVLDKYLSENNGGCICIDASGGFVNKILRADKSTSSPIFLFEMVINTGKREDYNQFPVAQMLSERHTSVAIFYWIAEFIRLGSVVKTMPNEIVCDSSRALLLGVLWNYTNCKTLEEYSDRCLTGPLPKCYIRIYVAHMVKIYANFLKNQHRSIKNFYLGAIAKLIVSRNFDEAKNILTLILTISRSEYQGNNSLSEKTKCSLAKEKLKKLLICKEDDYETGNKGVDDVLKLVKDIEDCDDNDAYERLSEEETSSKQCLQWAEEIDKAVTESCNEWGEDVNGHRNNDLANKIVQHCQTICMWTCVVRDRFGFGRVPASSAPVESEFNDLKNRSFGGKLPLRLDDFVVQHIKYIGNRNKIVIARENSRKEEKPNETEPEELEEKVENVVSVDHNQNHVISQNSVCPLCQDGEPNEAAHRCKDCLKVVHILPLCSVSLVDEAEGFGQKRLCLACNKRRDANNNKNVRAAYNEKEDWGGLVTAAEGKANRRGKYINGIFNKEDFELHPKFKKIPLLLNGNILKLKAITIDGRSCTIVNSCAFDSIFQTLLLIEMDKPFLGELDIDNLFFKTILHVAEKGVTVSAYANRAKLLYYNECSSINSLTKDSVEVVCTSNVGELANILLNDLPSLKTISSCKSGCTRKEEQQTHIMIPYEYLTQPDFDAKIQEIFVYSIKKWTCRICNEDCQMTQNNTGPILFLDVCVNCESEPVAIECLDMIIKMPAADYRLIGILDYIKPRNLRNLSENVIGHYRAIGRRPNNTWIAMDDLQKTIKKIKKNNKVTPLYLTYIRNV